MNNQQALEKIGIVSDWLNGHFCHLDDMPPEKNYARIMAEVPAYLEKRLDGTAQGAAMRFDRVPDGQRK